MKLWIVTAILSFVISLSCNSQELRKATTDDPFGVAVATGLAEKAKVLLLYDFGVSESPKGGFLQLVTIGNAAFEKFPQWDGSTSLPIRIEKLIEIAHVKVGKGRYFVEISIVPSHADPTKKVVLVTFATVSEESSMLDRHVIYLSLDGMVLDVETRPISDEQVASLMEHGIPKGVSTSGKMPRK